MEIGQPGAGTPWSGKPGLVVWTLESQSGMDSWTPTHLFGSFNLLFLFLCLFCSLVDLFRGHLITGALDGRQPPILQFVESIKNHTLMMTGLIHHWPRAQQDPVPNFLLSRHWTSKVGHPYDGAVARQTDCAADTPVPALVLR